MICLIQQDSIEGFKIYNPILNIDDRQEISNESIKIYME